MRHLVLAAILVASLHPQQTLADLQITMLEGYGQGLPHSEGRHSAGSSSGERMLVEKAIAGVFRGEFREWRHDYPKDSKVIIDHCVLRLTGHHTEERSDGTTLVTSVEGYVDFGKIDWDTLRITQCYHAKPRIDVFDATVIFDTNQPSGKFGKTMYITTEMPSETALGDALRFIHDSCNLTVANRPIHY